VLTQLVCATLGHTLLHTGRPFESSVIGRLITSCPAQLGSRHIAAGSITVITTHTMRILDELILAVIIGLLRVLAVIVIFGLSLVLVRHL